MEALVFLSVERHLNVDSLSLRLKQLFSSFLFLFNLKPTGHFVVVVVGGVEIASKTYCLIVFPVINTLLLHVFACFSLIQHPIPTHEAARELTLVARPALPYKPPEYWQSRPAPSPWLTCPFCLFCFLFVHTRHSLYVAMTVLELSV